MTDKSALYEWLDKAIDALPSKGQITLNFDADTVVWEVKAVYNDSDNNGHCERTEVRRTASLRIRGRERHVPLAAQRR